MNEIDTFLIHGSSRMGLYKVYRTPINEIMNLKTLKARKAKAKCDVSNFKVQFNDPFAQVYFSENKRMQRKLRPVLKELSLNQYLENDLHYVIVKNGKLVNTPLNKKNQAHYNNDHFLKKNTKLSICQKETSKTSPDKTKESHQISRSYMARAAKSNSSSYYKDKDVVVRKSERIRKNMNEQIPHSHIKDGYNEINTINKCCMRNTKDSSEKENLFNSNPIMDKPKIIKKGEESLENCEVSALFKGKLNMLYGVSNVKKKTDQKSRKYSASSRNDMSKSIKVSNIHQKSPKDDGDFVSEAKDTEIYKKRKSVTCEERICQKEDFNQIKLKELPNREAKRGTLKYLMQKQCHFRDSLSNREEMDFFNSSQRETKHALYDLFEVDLNESLTIKTPKDKNKQCYSGLTPRSELLDELGNKIKLPTPLTPSQTSTEDQKVASQLLFRHLNDKKLGKKRNIKPRSSKINLYPKFKNFNKELPVLPEEERENFSFDDYFNTS